MKFCKVHLPDGSKAFSFVKKYGGIGGTWLGMGIGFAIGWSGIVIAVACVFAGIFAFKALVAMCMALVDVMKIAGRFIKSGMDGLSDGENMARQPEIDTPNFGGRAWRRSA